MKDKTKKTLVFVFIIGILILVLFSFMGMVYITKSTFDDNGAAKLNNFEKGLARMSIVVQWLLIAWIIFGLSSGIVTTIFNDTSCLNGKK
jgi:hypothetical protein